MTSENKIPGSISLKSLDDWIDAVPAQIAQLIRSSEHGDFPKWMAALRALPQVNPSAINLDSGEIIIGNPDDCSDAERAEIVQQLKTLIPWRKGPFNLFGISIDTEWRSDLKWERLKNKIQPLRNRIVLDIGCGSGYHLLRMAGQGARLAIGVEPALLYYMQFSALQKYLNHSKSMIVPIGIEALPKGLTGFDTVFSMGLLYHRKDPEAHAEHLFELLRDGGELVMETLIIEGEEDTELIPKDRYAQMRNVWHIPTVPRAERWLKEAGFKNIRLIDKTQTTSEEQRVTDWMQFQSLKDFLNPDNPNETVEGYPAPIRALFLAEK